MCTSPWAVEGPYTDAAEKNVLGGLTVQGFLSQVMTIPDIISTSINRDTFYFLLLLLFWPELYS